MDTVLLTNAQLRKTLAAVRSLGEKGIPAMVCEETRWNLAGFSKYSRKNLLCPSPKRAPEEFYAWLKDGIVKYQWGVLFPMDDDTMDIAQKHRDELEKLCKVPLPPFHSYEITADKGETLDFIQRLGIGCPKTVIPSGRDELLALCSGLAYPLAVKPRKSSGARGIRIVNNEEELLREFDRIHGSFPNPIIQEYIQGAEVYEIGMLYNSGNRLKAHFIQRHLRRFPLEKGPSVVQESVFFPELLDTALKIMNSLEWYGIIDMEFLYDPENKRLYFMEFNPRFWNSLQMAIYAGVDFPWLLYRMLTEGDVDGVVTYKAGVLCRNLLPGDLLHFIFNKDRKNMVPSFFSGKKKGVLDDIVSKRDPMPVAGFLSACFRYLPDAKMWKFMFKR